MACIKFISVVFAVILICSPYFYANAYEVSTHEYLTQEIADFYEQSLPGQKISYEARIYLLDGSAREDDTPRYMNHFYDPIHNRGLTYDGAIDPTYHLGSYGTSKDWAQNERRQTAGLYTASTVMSAILGPLTEGANANNSNFTWQAGIRAYARGDNSQAMFVLGHILHLIEDLGVPEHVRNDPHGSGSAYEKWVEKITSNDADLSSALIGKSPFFFNDLNSYFDKLATYTNTHFYSPQTIGIQSGFASPNSEVLGKEKDGTWFRWGMDDQEGYRLVQQVRMDRLGYLASDASSLSIVDENRLVFKDYWSHLAPKIVQYGAGVVDLFFKEGEKAKSDPSFNKDEPKSLVGEVLDAFHGATSLLTRFINRNDPPVAANPVIPVTSNPSTQSVIKNALSTSSVSLPTSSKVFAIQIQTDRSSTSTPASEPITAAPPIHLPVQTYISALPPQLSFSGGSYVAASYPISENEVSSTASGSESPSSTQPAFQPFILSFAGVMGSSSIRFEWEVATSTTVTSTLKDVTAGTQIYEGNDNYFDASTTEDGSIHIFELAIEDSIATTSIQMPSPPPLPGFHDLTARVNPLTHGIEFRARLISPTEGRRVRFDISIRPQYEEFGAGSDYSGSLINSGEEEVLNTDAFQEGIYKWRAKFIYEDPVHGLQSWDWTDPQEITLNESDIPDPIVSGSFGFPNGYCGFNRAEFSPVKDFILTSSEFWASCGNGLCYSPNTFQIYNASGSLIAETDGGASYFGYPGLNWMWQRFNESSSITLRAGEMYSATPHSQNGTCMVDTTGKKNSFYLRGTAL